jgi:hypothetical protein
MISLSQIREREIIPPGICAEPRRRDPGGSHKPRRGTPQTTKGPACLPRPAGDLRGGWGKGPAGRGEGQHPGYLPRKRGSITSRRASPKTLNEKTIRVMAIPGQIAIHGLRRMNCSPAPLSIAPRSGCGGGTP